MHAEFGSRRKNGNPWELNLRAGKRVVDRGTLKVPADQPNNIDHSEKCLWLVVCWAIQLLFNMHSNIKVSFRILQQLECNYNVREDSTLWVLNALENTGVENGRILFPIIGRFRKIKGFQNRPIYPCPVTPLDVK
ncbi:hypothetical protein H6P81_001181 [Aristolochia fimbriata]|uniref:Uncharacterized protein n=1 Tax=Aristolochia fimbriata TaxID=158543 RepID=A0AAV7F6R0_ARIFI|nr:hypothetical protein H6P81_001181 [Aristolochia fimbriata]